MFKRIPTWFFGFITVLAVCLPLFEPTFFRLHDYVHAARIIEIIRALQDGNFPVRWSSNFGYGYGMPLFEFYAPLPYYTGALFYTLGLNVVAAIKMLFFLCSLMTFIGMYKLGSKLFGKAGGILSAVALTMAPYRAVNLYVRGALSEAWGIMALPWVLFGAVQIIKKEKNGWLSLLFGLVVLFLSHNITTLIFIPISILFVIGYSLMTAWKNGHFKKDFVMQLLQLIKVGALYIFGVALAAFYIFPAFLEKDYTKVNAIFSGYFAYSNHFLYIRQFFIPNWGYGGSVWGPDDGLSFFLGYGQLFGLALVLIWLLKAIMMKLRELKLKQQHITVVNQSPTYIFMPVLCLLLMGVAAFMTLLKSKPIWDVLPFMVAVQFPWRWLSVIILFLALLVGMATVYIRHKFLRYIYVVVLSFIIIFTNLSYFKPESYLKNNDDLYFTDANRIRSQMSAILPDYIPKQMPDEFAYNPVGNVVMPAAGVEEKVIEDKVQEKKVQVVTNTLTEINFAIADYPGWTVLIDGKVSKKTQGKIGNLAVMVPQGSHEITAQFRDTPIRAYSDEVSLVAFILFLVIFAIYRYQQKRASYVG